MLRKVTGIIISLLLVLIVGCAVSVDITTLDFGSTETSKTFTITVQGPVKWSISCNESWVTINPAEDQGKGVYNINTTVDRTGLAIGDYETTLNISTTPSVPCPDIIIKMSVVAKPPLPSEISGYVYENSTGNPIPGALVSISNTSYYSAGNGYYIINVVPGSYTINASKEGYEDYSSSIVVPEDDLIDHDIYMIKEEVKTSSTTTTQPTTTTTQPTTTTTEPSNYSISGTVTGDVQADVILTLSGDSSGTVTSGLDGTYSFNDLPNGSYTVTPSLACYTFSPEGRDVTVADWDETGVDFISSEEQQQLDGEYLEIDVFGGPTTPSYPVTELSSQPTLTNDYKTTKVLLRKITSAGQTFTMGSPEDENGRGGNESQHQVTFTKDYYIGVFEITQRQYELVMGTTPSYSSGNMRPVERVSWNTIRGGTWPGDPAGSGQPGSDTFMDRLRSKTGLDFDLPTEAQWEYACRATTTRAYNDYTKNGGEGSDCLVASGDEEDTNLNPLAWYTYNASSQGHQEVGTKQANLWGLYNMHGNVQEWCLDWDGDYSGNETDPLGTSSGSQRVIRGGGWYLRAGRARSANRESVDPTLDSYPFWGFRLCLPQ